jgi:hypothetical protein
MAIAHQQTESNSNGGTTIIAHPAMTPSGSDVILISKISYKDTTDEIASVRWRTAGDEGDALIYLRDDVNGDARSAIYYLINPAQAARSVWVTFNTSVRVAISASIYTGVHQTTPFSSNAGNNGTDNAPTVTVTAGANTMVVDALCQVSAGPDTATKQNETERANLAATGGGTDVRHASQEDSTGPSTMAWSMSDSDNWALSSGTLQEPAVGGDLSINVSECIASEESLS